MAKNVNSFGYMVDISQVEFMDINDLNALSVAKLSRSEAEEVCRRLWRLASTAQHRENNADRVLYQRATALLLHIYPLAHF